jgi:hypothetical protein
LSLDLDLVDQDLRDSLLILAEEETILVPDVELEWLVVVIWIDVGVMCEQIDTVALDVLVDLVIRGAWDTCSLRVLLIATVDCRLSVSPVN